MHTYLRSALSFASYPYGKLWVINHVNKSHMPAPNASHMTWILIWVVSARWFNWHNILSPGPTGWAKFCLACPCAGCQCTVRYFWKNLSCWWVDACQKSRCSLASSGCMCISSITAQAHRKVYFPVPFSPAPAGQGSPGERCLGSHIVWVSIVAGLAVRPREGFRALPSSNASPEGQG